MATEAKDFARHVQGELSKDETLERPSYQWCLQQVNKLMVDVRENAKGDNMKMIVAHMKELFVARIKPLAHKERQ